MSQPTQEIEIQTRDGARMVPAKIVRGGLAVTAYLRRDYSVSDGHYQITHVQSGLHLPSNGSSYKLREAGRVLDWYLEFMNWDRPQSETIAEFQRSPRVRDLLIALLRLERSNWSL